MVELYVMLLLLNITNKSRILPTDLDDNIVSKYRLPYFITERSPKDGIPFFIIVS